MARGPAAGSSDPRAPPAAAAAAAVAATTPAQASAAAAAVATGARTAHRHGQISVALVCRSNVNRSMEAHYALLQHGYHLVSSFGVGTKVSLVGEVPGGKNEFPFGTPYTEMAADLRRKGEEVHQRLGTLPMLERDARVKAAPERWQDARTARFDLVLTFEMHVYNTVVDDLRQRTGAQLAPCHVVNLETPDTHEDASRAAVLALRLVNALHAAIAPPAKGAEAAAALLARLSQHLPRPESTVGHADATHWEDKLPPLLEALENEIQKPIDHAVLWI